ncbi:MAG: phosphoethanolamine--lipid A transferase [Simplicispira sp.]|uniref:phosphoethanolamine transferase n=1 Tax=Simplicispira sp. TaxID=2015802 RepID=UPI00258CE738|nr:phosphoethanolamine--lipid A transferase [Simplicispira sp.]MDD2692708.1 phosphoethanolamine--lipid A transferase [Simplicispira sp.]
MPHTLTRWLPFLANTRTPFHSSDTANAPQAWHPAWLVVLVSVWLATACNVPLWREVAALPDHTGLRGASFGLAFAVIVAAGNVALLSLLAWGRGLKPALVLVVLMAALGTYFMLSYGIVIDASMLTNVLQTDVREAGDLLNWRLAATVLALAAPPLWWLLQRPVRPLGALRHVAHNGLLLLGAVVVLVASLLLVFQDFASTMRNHTQLRYLINPLNSVYALGHIATKPLRIDTSTMQPLGRDAQLGASYAGQTKPPLLVLVLGETARSANFGLNGYARPTTPLLSARSDLVSATNAWSCGTSTAASLPCMFSHLGRDGFEGRKTNSETLLDVLQHAGLAVLWVDNQSGCKGVCDRVAQTSTTALKDPALCPDGECSDPIMLKVLEERIAALPAEQRARGTVVVLHQMGSHGPAYYKRSDASLKRFGPECTSNALQECDQAQVVNAYDNSIVATDHFLNATIQWLETQADKAQTAMVYVSDHGESLGEGNLYLHGLPYAIAPDVQKQVPWITWLSPAMQSRSGVATACLQKDLAQRRITHDGYFHAVLGLMDVQSTVYQAEQDIYAPCRNTRQAPMAATTAPNTAHARS